MDILFEPKEMPFISENVYAGHVIQHLEKGQLMNCTGKLVDVMKAFKNRKIVLYYFSASWCGPCKQLLPRIKEIYKKSKEIQAGLEIIYVSSDTDSELMVKYFKERHGGWYAVPAEDIGAESLRKMYGVTHIPQIIVVKTDGTIISRQGVKDINDLKLNVLVAWNADPV